MRFVNLVNFPDFSTPEYTAHRTGTAPSMKEAFPEMPFKCVKQRLHKECCNPLCVNPHGPFFVRSFEITLLRWVDAMRLCRMQGSQTYCKIHG